VEVVGFFGKIANFPQPGLGNPAVEGLDSLTAAASSGQVTSAILVLGALGARV